LLVYIPRVSILSVREPVWIINLMSAMWRKVSDFWDIRREW
jgi:hypothetical protein